jgi:hypothetical protein
MPPEPVYKSPPYVQGETWEQYATRFLETSKKPNALEHYLKALRLVNIDPFNREANYDINTIFRFGWNQPFPKAEKALELNHDAIQEVLRGAELNQCKFPPTPYGDKIPNPVMPMLRSQVLAKLTALTGMKLVYENKPHDALVYYLAGIQFGKDIGQKGQSLMPRLISIAVITINSKPLLQLISQDKLNEKDYQNIITDLNRIE